MDGKGRWLIESRLKGAMHSCTLAHPYANACSLSHTHTRAYRFSVRVLTTLCEQSEGQPLAGVVVIGDGNSARAVAMAGSSMGLPVLWAKGGTANLDGMHREASCAASSTRRRFNYVVSDSINVLRCK